MAQGISGIFRGKRKRDFPKSEFCIIMDKIPAGKDGSAVEKRRIRLEINGVVCGLITPESEEYMQSLADEVGALMQNILEASPYITREAAALTAALSYCDDAKKNGKQSFDLQERIDELEVEAEIWQEEKEELLKKGPAGEVAAEDPALREKLLKLEAENTALAEAAGRVKELEEQAARLADENAALRENSGGSSAADHGELSRRLSEAEEANRALRDKLTEKDGERQKAEQEKQGAIAAAKRAVEEAKKMVDQLRLELEETRKEAAEAKKRASSPALDLLEKEVREQGEERKPAPSQPAGGKKRKNPMRYEEEYEQEGFISFFEKS